jgi:hypothetical protein
MLGDVNHDGAINVLDVQATIGQALGAIAQSVEANVDENEQVDVLDVQNMVNSVLGEGGLVQRVSGTINCQGDCDMLWIRAMSMDGQTEQAAVDPETGQFLLRLRVKAAWSLTLCQMVQVENQLQERRLATFEFGVGSDDESSTLPLLNLAREELCLGVLERDQDRLRTREMIQQMLSEMAGEIDPSDGDGNGIPDFVEPLLNRLSNGPGVPQHANMARLFELIGPCVAAWVAAGVQPDLTDANGNGIPDFVEPLLDCIHDVVVTWLEDEGVNIPPNDQDGNGTPDFVDAILNHVQTGVHAWLGQIGPRELVDENSNGIPDYIENRLCLRGALGPFDSDGDGIPNYAEDYDGDGIPNIYDPDCRNADDSDGDGVPNQDDLDDDNDGIPDYAD